MCWTCGDPSAAANAPVGDDAAVLAPIAEAYAKADRREMSTGVPPKSHNPKKDYQALAALASLRSGREKAGRSSVSMLGGSSSCAQAGRFKRCSMCRGDAFIFRWSLCRVVAH